MWKILLLIFFYALTCTGQTQGLKTSGGQLGRLGINKGAALDLGDGGLDGVGNPYDPLTTAYFARLDSLGIVYNTALKNEFNTYFFAKARLYGILDTILAVYITIPETSLGLTDTTRVKQNLLNNKYTLTTFNAVVWRLGLDVGGNGTSSYISTNYNPITSGDTSIYKRFSGGIYIYSPSAINAYYYSSFQTAKAVYLNPTGTVININHNSPVDATRADTNRAGRHATIRTSLTVLNYYRSGSLIQSFTNTASLMPSTTIDWFCLNNNGTRQSFNAVKIRVFAITGGLSAWGVGIFDTIISEWMAYKGL